MNPTAHVRLGAALPLLALGAVLALPAEASQGLPTPAPAAALVTAVSEPSTQQSTQRRRRPQVRDTLTGEIGGAGFEIGFGIPEVGGPEHEAFRAATPGGALLFRSAPAIRLRTEGGLAVGEAELPAGNAAKDFPGLYAVWLRRTNDGWELAFDEQADAWGTQYEADAVIASAALEHAAAEESQERFGLTYEAEDESSGRLVLAWGEDRWSVDVRALD